MEISKTYDPKSVEDKWYAAWDKAGHFNSKPDEREPFTIAMPPPNITGVLHMGHILNNTIQDILIRKARLQGKNANWVPGTDHASIATEAKVVEMLRERSIDKKDISREDFIKHAYEWKEKYGGIILNQLRKIGASCDWNRINFTMDESYYEAVIKVFVDLHNKGFIYRGVRIVNWDPKAQTAVSDEEVIHKEIRSKLYYVNYKFADGKSHITIATTRPETILGDTAVCVNPADDRYKGLVGKKVLVPLVNREVPLIADEYVDMEFGTGALKITPAHDINDYELGIKHKLDSIDIFNDDASLSEAAELFVGEDRFKARKLIVAELKAAGQLEKEEDYQNKIGYSERTNEVIEPKLSMQWFCKMAEMGKPAQEHVMNDDIQFHPAKFKNMYRHWMENIKDWCISRQLWWGQRIPAWYIEGSHDYVVAATENEALELARKKTGKPLQANDLSQDEDVLDTWFSSWLWPIQIFGGIKDEKSADLAYYNPTSVLVTAPDIIFFWVARMIMANYEYLDKKPFEHVYFTGLVRDPQGQKMSKSLGNSPDPLELIDTYGADGVRFGILISAPAGNDLLFDIKLCEQGRNFSNKIWNALRLIKGWETHNDPSSTGNKTAMRWFESRLSQGLAQLEKSFSTYHISEALKSLYTLIWDDFCSWYLEMVKPARGEKLPQEVYDKSVEFFEQLLSLLHPFMPFVTEEIYQQLKKRAQNEHLMVGTWPKEGLLDKELLRNWESIKEVITEIRNLRGQAQMKSKDLLKLITIDAKDENVYRPFESILTHLSGSTAINYSKKVPEDTTGFMVGTDKFNVSISLDAGEEKEKLEKELAYFKGFQKSVSGKLNNKSFVDNAPVELVDKERKKLQDAEEKIKILEDSLSKLN